MVCSKILCISVEVSGLHEILTEFDGIKGGLCEIRGPHQTPRVAQSKFLFQAMNDGKLIIEPRIPHNV